MVTLVLRAELNEHATAKIVSVTGLVGFARMALLLPHAVLLRLAPLAHPRSTV